MNLRYHSALVAAALILCAACESTVDVPDPVGLPVAFEYGVIRRAVEAPFEIVQNEPLIVRGYFQSPCSPHNVSASARVEKGTLVLLVEGRSAGACHTVISDVGYQATVTVAASSYNSIKVVHLDAGRAADTVFRSGRNDSVAVARDTSALVQTSALRYAFTGSTSFIQAEIPYTYRNVLADTMYIANCNGAFGVTLLKKQGEQWVFAWHPVLPMCLSQPIVIPPGGKYESKLVISGSRPGHNAIPEFPAGNLDGTYRLVISTVVLHYQGGSGAPIAEKYKTSNSFFLDDPQ